MATIQDDVVRLEKADGSRKLVTTDCVYDLTEDKTQEAVNSEIKNTLDQLIQESAFEIVEENGEFKLYWYGAQGECPYTIVYENGVYNLYFNYTTA